MSNLREYSFQTSLASRSALNGHQPLLVWFTGLSGSGKSTLADALEAYLISLGIHAYHIDGDSIRLGLNADLGFTMEDRDENIRRVSEVSVLMLDAGMVVIAAFVSPLIRHREMVRSRAGHGRFMEVYVNTPIEVCESRDVKGLYAKARRGEIQSFTGVSDPYEAPLSPELTIDTSRITVEEAVSLIHQELVKMGVLNK